jgi:hypothetical protein
MPQKPPPNPPLTTTQRQTQDRARQVEHSSSARNSPKRPDPPIPDGTGDGTLIKPIVVRAPAGGR